MHTQASLRCISPNLQRGVEGNPLLRVSRTSVRTTMELSDKETQREADFRKPGTKIPKSLDGFEELSAVVARVQFT